MPNKMTTVASFADAAKILGLKLSRQRPLAQEKVKKCFTCGAPMYHVPGTNVTACTGEVPAKGKDGKVIKDKSGKTVLTVCRNVILA